MLLTLSAALGLAMTAARAEDDGAFNQPGNILITDQFNNRAIEIDPAGKIVWRFGIGPNDISPNSAVGTNDAERVGDFTLIAGTGIPSGVSQASAQCLQNGCADNRVFLVNREGDIVWQYGQFGVTGSDFNQLNVPVQNTFVPVGDPPNGFLPSGNVLITDQANERIIEVRISDKALVWQYGTTGVAGAGDNQLNNPNAAELLTNGNILISDENNNRAIEVTHTTPSTIVRTFSAQGTVSGMAFASRLPNDHTLLTDANNNRIVEVNRKDQKVWEYFTNTDPASNAAPLPTRAVRLTNGNTVISDQFNNRVIVVNRAKQIVASYGTINVFGINNSDATVMNGPYSAYVIGDYTGMTPPF
jgi:hypothetical protein